MIGERAAMKVLVAMSGGVDSAVTAAKMIAAGHEVSAVHLSLARSELAGRAGVSGCGSPADEEDAKKVAAMLGIGIEIWDFSDRFADVVLTDFLSEYAAGRTPNPCLRCNENIKFAALLDRGLELGYDMVATGHYAQVKQGPDGPTLWRAVDDKKDQSYVLAVLKRHQLEHSIFPLGGMTKPQVRAEAAALGIPVASKPDSTDICFIKDGDTAGFLREKLGDRPGQIVDTSGQVLGNHDGTFCYTIGQRKGLNIGTPAADGKPRYVIDINPVERKVVVGGADKLFVNRLSCIKPSWTGDQPIGKWRGLVQVRAHGAPMPATIEASENGVEYWLDEPCRGVAPGQYAVCYLGNQVIGSSVIAKAFTEES